MIDHITLRVSDVGQAKRFYEAALAPLGYEVVMEWEEYVGLGVQGKPDFWLAPGKGTQISHVAFRARDRKTVDAFYAAALAAGGKDNGPPGPREQYHPTYYGAFVHDADGNNIEACCHEPPQEF